jgi:glycosyltransferase involved in cell wall biosynthesis
MPSISVVICTHNRVDLLGKTLESLNRAERPRHWQVDILVIANACTDATHHQLDAYVQAADGRLPLCWLAEPTPGKSNALNKALPLIEADIAAFVDDDHRVAPDYLLEIARAAEVHPDADLFCGRILPDWDGSEPAWVHDTGPYRIYPLPVPRFDLGPDSCELTADIAIPGGGNLFLRRPWLARVGRFATDFGPIGHNLGGAEDLEWVIRALRMGAKLRYVPAVLQYHYVDGARLTLPYLIQKAYVRSASSVRLDNDIGGVPRYMYRKLLSYLFAVLTAVGTARRRFFLVRLAAALGEASGYRQNRRAGKGGT